MKILGSRKPVQPQVGWFHKSVSYGVKIHEARKWLEGRARVKAYQRITKKKEV
jgi:hypothetical protein